MKTKIAYLTALPLVCALLAPHALADNEAAKQDYMQYCASCHGADGKGNGPQAIKSERPPSDLTQLSQAHNGHFPYAKVRKIIDGRAENGKIRVHGTDMPVWGRVFREQQTRAGAQLHADAVAKMRILNIVDYIASIQTVDVLKIKRKK